MGEYTSLALDSADRPHISYYDASNKHLKYAWLCAPVEGVSITGPEELLVGESGLYTATYTPPTATVPVISWDNGTLGPTATYSWTVPGSYSIAVSATNSCGGPVSDTLAVFVCQPAGGAAFAWTPISPTVGQVVTFTGRVSGSLPVTYSWAFGDGGVGEGEEVTHAYTAVASYTVVMTAANLCGEDRVTESVVVSALPPRVYLPLVLKER